jgi:hypothetical protein
VLRSRHLDVPDEVRVDAVLEATTRWPVTDPDDEPVVAGLRRDAGLRGGQALPLTREGFLGTGAAGRPLPVAVLGPPAEGASYYNHYVPSPAVPSRALQDIDRILASFLPAVAAPELEILR